MRSKSRCRCRCRSKTRTTTLRGGGEGKQTSDRHFDLCTDRTRLIGSSPPKGKSHNGSSRSRILGSDRKLLLHSQSWHIFSSSRHLSPLPSLKIHFSTIRFFPSLQRQSKARCCMIVSSQAAMQWWPSCSPRRSAVSSAVQQGQAPVQGKGGDRSCQFGRRCQPSRLQTAASLANHVDPGGWS